MKACSGAISNVVLLMVLVAGCLMWGKVARGAVVDGGAFKGSVPTVSFESSDEVSTNVFAPTAKDSATTNGTTVPALNAPEGWAPPMPRTVTGGELEAPGEDSAAAGGGWAVFERSGMLFFLLAALFVVALIILGLNALARHR